jgi:hypothetical protein
MVKKNKALEAKPGNTSRASKGKASSQQSAPLASALSLLKKAKKPKVIAAEAAGLPPGVAKGASATNVALTAKVCSSAESGIRGRTS